MTLPSSSNGSMRDVAGDCEFFFGERPLATGHFLGHVHHELAVFPGCFAQQTAKLI
jgi:hypothetical protein